MNTYEINSVLENHPVTRLFQIGTFACDQLPTKRISEYPFIGVVNHDPSSKPGSHWTSFVVFDSGVEYFDSYGLPPTPPILDFLDMYSDILWNKTVIQDLYSSVCGAHALYFLIQRCIGYSMYDIINHLYSKDLQHNDCKALLLISPYVNQPLKTLCINQTCTMKSK